MWLLQLHCWWWQQLLPCSWTSPVCRRMPLFILFPSFLSSYILDSASLKWPVHPPFPSWGRMLWGLVTALGSWQQPWAPRPSRVPGPSSPLLSWPPCSVRAALQQQEEEGRPWNSAGGMFLWGVEEEFLNRKEKKKKNHPSLTNWDPSLTRWLLQHLLCYQLWSPYLQGTSYHFSAQCWKCQSSHYLVLADTVENSEGTLELGIALICRNKLLPVNS